MKEGLEKYRHVLVITDKKHEEKALRMQRELQNRGKSVQLEVMASLDVLIGKELVSNQPIGRGLIIFGEGTLGIERVAVSAGYSRDDIFIDSSQESRAFCSQCHHITIIGSDESFICENCLQQLEPSEHYSTYHRASLAYPVFKETDGKG
ncbi:hypothetical protein [Guptibacillus algicola]|uniref:hypothetical protein n=1 Tax=Guptibacillus algicola TaxID=225844 RepID=UPI001CD3D8CF|nr:hypothetical protein [Alkalihalobacillus algicola]MCA0988588.1 hypothetical protein [Alkalihalobacillus algicola]